MKDGIIKLGCGVPNVRVADPKANANEIINLVKNAADDGVKVLALPELCLTGATCGDLFTHPMLLDSAKNELDRICRETEKLDIFFFVGLPIERENRIYNVCAAVFKGEILGYTAKNSIKAFGDSADARWFSPATELSEEIWCNGIYSCGQAKIGIVFASDLESPMGPAGKLVSGGANIIVCPDASAEIICRESWKQKLVEVESGKLLSCILYANAGPGESTTDLVYGGQMLIACGGKTQACSGAFEFEQSAITFAVCDLEHLSFNRKRFGAAQGFAPKIELDPGFTDTETDIQGCIDPLPFIPKTEARRLATCARILEIQSRGLARRLEAAHASGAVVAISGGLDSCLALLVTARAFDILHRDRKDILTVTMPCYGTTKRTRGNAEQLCDELGTSFKCIDIAEAVGVHFRDIEHDPSDHSVVYENSQARERTQIIMDIANGTNAIVVGTGDLSELALGWATYNGDHMSNYGVNGGIPKTLIRYVVAYCADSAAAEGKTGLAEVLRDILDTPVSPELLPADNGEISQKTEDIVGPYELHDFFIYRMIRYGERPAKIFRMALAAFADDRRFTPEIIHKWLRIFTRRFFIQQFKRSCLPDGPKVGAVALSPRGEWKMPSDAEARIWLDEVDSIVIEKL